MAWPPEHIELLRELYQQGPRSWVAGELTTRTGIAYGRNAVVGKLHRLGLCEPKQTKDKPKVRDKKFAAPADTKRLRSGCSGEGSPDDPESVGEGGPSQFVLIINLQQHHCRYICSTVGETTYCGRRKMDGSSYCAEHHRLCYYGHGRYISA